MGKTESIRLTVISYTYLCLGMLPFPETITTMIIAFFVRVCFEPSIYLHVISLYIQTLWDTRILTQRLHCGGLSTSDDHIKIYAAWTSKDAK